MKNIHAVALGSIKSELKANTARENGKRGGRPRKPKEIPLTLGKVALVDAEDYEWLMQWKWHALKQGKGDLFYAVRSKGSMHAQIMNTPKGMQTDHINGNGLDNRRCNLRICTPSENQWNSKKRCDNVSGFKGVSINKTSKKESWKAVIRIHGKTIFIGCFKTAEEAYKAYCEACVKYHGEFANLG